MRRRRRIDVYQGESPSRVGIDAMFRDTYVRTDGVETIIHEYTLDAVVDTETGVIVESGPHRGCCPGRNAREPSPALHESPE